MFIITRNMGLQGCSNIYMLILLLSAIAAISAQTDPTEETSSIGIDNDSNNDSNASNDTSIAIGDNSNNTTNESPGDDSKNDTSTSTNNGSITSDDVKNDINNITSCVMHTKVIGTLVIQIIQLTKIFFILVPGLEGIIQNYFNYIFACLIDMLVDVSQVFQIIVKLTIPFLQLGLMFT